MIGLTWINKLSIVELTDLIKALDLNSNLPDPSMEFKENLTEMATVL
jgi:hypothetical protein